MHSHARAWERGTINGGRWVKFSAAVMSHDQNFKNLILDYPRQALEFFAADAKIDLGYPPERRLEVFLKAQEGLVTLEQNLDKQLKYIEFIEQYANLTEAEKVEYLSTYLPNSDYQESIMGPIQNAREEGIQQGIQQGIRQQLLAGIELGLELKFGVSGLALLPEIQKLQDADVLHAIHEGLKIAQTLDELRGIYAKS